MDVSGYYDSSEEKLHLQLGAVACCRWFANGWMVMITFVKY